MDAMGTRALSVAFLLLGVLAAGCKHEQPLDTQALDQAGMWFASVQELKGLNVTQPEVEQLALARDAGLSDAGCVELVKLARSRSQAFAEGSTIVNLHNGGFSESSILELARLNQLSSWSGEALAVRLTGVSDEVVMTLARQRASGTPAMSGASLSRLKGTGLSDSQLLDLIHRGTTDAKAQEIISARVKATTPTGFVRRSPRRR
jgi:hypothetical protein